MVLMLIKVVGRGLSLISFLAAYANILVMSLLFAYHLLGSDLYSSLSYVTVAFMSFLLIWAQGF